jgi:hypothetical protein
MDDALKEFFSIYVALFCLGVYVFTFAIRKVVDRALIGRPTLLGWWSEVGVPLLPVLLGVLCALGMKKYPYPPLVQAHGIRVFFGATCGFFSAWVYKLARGVLGQATPKKDADSEPPMGDPAP